MPGEIRDLGGIGNAGEKLAGEMEGCAAVNGGSGGGATWLGEVHVCGVRTVLWFVVVVLAKNRQVWLNSKGISPERFLYICGSRVVRGSLRCPLVGKEGC